MTYVPLGFLIGISFTQWNILTLPQWVGLQNYRFIFSDFQNWFYLKVIGRTILYAVAILGLNIVDGFFTALVMNQNLLGRGLFRTMWYLPAVFSGAVVALLLKIYLAPSTQGVLNMLLFISVTGMIGSMQMCEVPKIITAGGPDNLTYTLIYSIHNDSFGALEMGLGTAQSFVLFIMLLLLIGWQLNEYRKQYGV